MGRYWSGYRQNAGRQWASVGLMARRPTPLYELEAEIVEAGGQAIAIPDDVSNLADVKKAIELMVNRFDGLHLAVNNAGISGEFGLLHEISIEKCKKVCIPAKVFLRHFW
nr:SDR family NAD(P)-dependent oxidoreductase [Spirosoma oryzae]